MFLYLHPHCQAATSPQPPPATEQAKNGSGPDSTQVDLSKVTIPPPRPQRTQTHRPGSVGFIIYHKVIWSTVKTSQFLEGLELVFLGCALL